jgi:hypothetical protein
MEGFRAEHIADLLSGLRHDDPSLTDLPGIQAWLRAFNHILDTSIVPVSWLRQVVITLYKGKDAPDTRARPTAQSVSRRTFKPSWIASSPTGS